MRFLPRGFAVCICITLLALAAASRPGPRPTAQRESSPRFTAKVALAMTHVTIINPQGPPQKDVTVLVSGGVIEWTGVATDARRPAHQDESKFDARGKFLIPGLWDMHTHIAGISANPAWSKNVLLPLLVANGITGIRDMGGDLRPLLEKARAAAAAWQENGPQQSQQ